MLADPFDEAGASLQTPANILLIDADPALRAALCGHLATPDVSLRTANDAAAALQYLKSGACDLVLIDLAAPLRDACAFIAGLRADTSLHHLPVVAIAGDDDMDAIDAAFAAGATSFVVKPMDFRLLLRRLRYILRAGHRENEMRTAQRRAEQAHAIKANVLRLVQHELRTPLTSIVGFAEHIEAYPTSSETAEFAGLIASAGRQFSANVTDLMVAAQILTAEIRLQTTETPVRLLIDTAVAAHAVAAQDKGVVLRGMDGTGGMVIECDRALIACALKHLVRNALDHGQGAVDVMATRERDGVALAIRDRGPGLDPAQLARCLEPFQQGDDALSRTSRGLGLGLPVAQHVLAAHGGALCISTVAGIGCIAIATLPTRAV